MAKAAAKSAPTWVALKVVLVRLEAIPDESPESARRLAIEGCRPGGPIRWKCREPANPPADSFCGDPSNFVISHSDVTNRAAGVFEWTVVAVTLRGVSLAWEDVAALRPEIGPSPMPAPKAKKPAQVWFDDALEKYPRERWESVGDYLNRLHTLMQDEVDRPWERSTLETRYYERQHAGLRRR
jgi:hypothetical protein